MLIVYASLSFLVLFDSFPQKVNCIEHAYSLVRIIYPAFLHQLYQLFLGKASFLVSTIDVWEVTSYQLLLDYVVILLVILTGSDKHETMQLHKMQSIQNDRVNLRSSKAL
jgi:hypothetical protein